MTEIKIEKKKPVWPWILLGLGIVAALIYFLANNNEEEEGMEMPLAAGQTPVREDNSTVAAFVDFVERDTINMGLDHAYVNEALLKLTEATKAMADKVDYDVRADLDRVKEYAAKITNDPFETTHADNIRKAADILTNVLQNMQQAKFSGLTNEVADLRNASAAIKPDVLTLEQKDAVKSFFSKAANLLKKMN